MLNRVYLNNAYIELKNAKISVLDRGFLFGDGVYEVIPIYNTKLFRAEEHLQRLEQSLQALKIKNPLNKAQWFDIFSTLMQKNQLTNASIYIQITRGAGSTRAHIPEEALTPTVFVACTALQKKTIAELKSGITAITMSDFRWQRCYIKSISLIANILALEHAHEVDAQATIFIRDGSYQNYLEFQASPATVVPRLVRGIHSIGDGSRGQAAGRRPDVNKPRDDDKEKCFGLVTEECMRNVFIVKDNIIKTPIKNEQILGGITRDVIIELARQNNLNLQETNITEQELLEADEVFVSSSTKEIVPVIKINDSLINKGQAGPTWEKLINLYHHFIKNYDE